MLKSEFESRVKMEVSVEEYAAIEVVYMNSDLDKDEFCSVWRKMNASRVKAAKEAARQKKEIEAAKDTIYRLFTRMHSTDQTPAIDFVTDKEREALARFDIRVWNEAWNCENTVADVWYEIYKRFKYVKIA